MNKIIKCFVVFVISLFIVTPFSIDVFADQEEIDTFEQDFDNFSEYMDLYLDGYPPISFFASSFNNSNVCSDFLSLTSSQRETIKSLDHSNGKNNLVLVSTLGSVYALTGAYFTSSAPNNDGVLVVYIDKTVSSAGINKINSDGSITFAGNNNFSGVIKSVFYWNQAYGGVNPLGSISFDPCTCDTCVVPTPPTPPNSVNCPVALNDVLSNDYVTSLLTWLYRGGVEQFIIYRVQHTYDISVFPPSTDVVQVGEFKGYVLTTTSNQVQTFVYDYNRPTVIKTDQGNLYYDYMDILDSDFVNEWEMVLHWTCLDTRYSSEFEAMDGINNSIQSTIQQNSTMISQNQTIIGQNSNMINQNQNIIDNTDEMINKQETTNDLILNGTSGTESILNDSSLVLDNITSDIEGIEIYESQFITSISSEFLPTFAQNFTLESLIPSSAFVSSVFDLVVESPFYFYITCCILLSIIFLIINKGH